MINKELRNHSKSNESNNEENNSAVTSDGWGGVTKMVHFLRTVRDFSRFSIQLFLLSSRLSFRRHFFLTERIIAERFYFHIVAMIIL